LLQDYYNTGEVGRQKRGKEFMSSKVQEFKVESWGCGGNRNGGWLGQKTGRRKRA
jgi:hypothetical protein